MNVIFSFDLCSSRSSLSFVEMPLDRATLEALHAKYTEMRQLRIADHESPTTDPRRSMAELAARFPGALREIDELPMEAIDAKLAALAIAIDDPPGAPQWMEAIALFHTLPRGALCAKRWLAGKKEVDHVMRATFEKSIADSPHAAEALVWLEDLDAIANPPRGRVTDLVYARIARELGISEDSARRAVFK